MSVCLQTLLFTGTRETPVMITVVLYVGVFLTSLDKTIEDGEKIAEFDGRR